MVGQTGASWYFPMLRPLRIPSIFWQFVWSWIVGPCVLWQTRKIKDTHYWTLQTRLAVIAG